MAEDDRIRREQERKGAEIRAGNRKRAAEIVGAHQLAFVVWTEELLRLIVDSGAATEEQAAVMLDRLQARLWSYNQDNPTQAYRIHPEVIEEESTRVAALASAYRKRRQDRAR